MARRTRRRRILFGIGGSFLVALVFTAALLGGRAQAGKTSTGALSVTSTTLWGSMGTARSAPDLVSLVQCVVMASDNGTPSGNLSARCTISMPDPNNPTQTISAACFTGNPALIAAIESAIDSRVAANIDANTGACTSITTFNSSEYAPKMP
jgi:hypothetical protein